MKKNKEIALMYSGGLDTTYLALQLAEGFSKVHLLTFCNGICLRVGASNKHALMLQEKYGKEKYEHAIISIGDIFAVIKKGITTDMLKYRSPLLFDLCCRLSMEMATICYCIEKGVLYATDGSNPYTQGEMFIQQGEYLNTSGELFSEYGIQYIQQYRHRESRQNILKKLEASGIKTGVRFFESIGITSQLFNQPFCLWAPIAFFFTSRLRKIPFIKYFGLSAKDAIRFRRDKEKIAKAFIDYFKLNHSLSFLYPCKKNNLTKFLRSRDCNC